MLTTKSEILNAILQRTKEVDTEKFIPFSANEIADLLCISRTLASQYLNEFVKDKVLIKIQSRPVYFFHKKTLENMFSTSISEESYVSIQELKEFLLLNKDKKDIFSTLIGEYGSLKSCITHCKASLKYPPRGLPIMLYGDKGTGKKYLSNLMFKYAKSKGLIGKNSEIIYVDAEFEERSFEDTVFGYFSDGKYIKGVIEKSQNGIICIKNSEKLKHENILMLQKFIETGNIIQSGSTEKSFESNARLIFLSDQCSEEALSSSLLQLVPLTSRLPNLAERFLEEKESMIFYFFKMEAIRINTQIYVSEAVVRLISDYTFDQNINGLKKTIQLICANAMVDTKNNFGKDMHIYVFHLPENILSNHDIISGKFNEDSNFINVTDFKQSNEAEKILSLFESILTLYKTYSSENNLCDIKEFLDESYNLMKKYYDYLTYDKKNFNNRIKTIERLLSEIFNHILKAYNINVPVNWSGTISRILYVLSENTLIVDQWYRKNIKEIQYCIAQLNRNYSTECTISERIARYIFNNIGINLNEMTVLILIIHLAYYNQEISSKKYLGIIVAHGYSTASSMADAANTLLGNYMFDAIDMPVDTTVSEIVNMIEKYISRTTVKNDLIVMVDMGSLEDIGTKLISSTNRAIGVINNVSTKLVLFAGDMMRKNYSLKEIMEKISSVSKATYKIVENRQKQAVIIFTSENGINTANRMVELFEKSLPKAIDVDIIACDYFELLNNKDQSEIIKDKDVLFVSGVSNPNITSKLFVPLEEIVSMDGLDQVYNDLQKYLSQKEIDQFRKNLMKNFSLQNVVRQLTILDPSRLMEFVTEAVELLQKNLNKQFQGKTIIGLYIHISLLIERLVTKDPMSNDKVESFIEKNKDFINIVQSSFAKIRSHFRIDLPVSEIEYLYEFIQLDVLNEKPVKKNWLMKY